MVNLQKALLTILIGLSGTAMAETSAAPVCSPGGVTLSQKDVAERVLRDGRRTREINLRYQQTRLTLTSSLAPLDWKFVGETGFKTDRSVGLNPVAFDNRENIVTTLSLSKAFQTGTGVLAEYSRNSFKGEPNALYNPTSAGVTLGTVDYFGLTLTQDLWANFFGKGLRALVDAAELSYQAATVGRTDDLENLVMESIQLFWTTYVSERNFREKIVSRERSQKLADAVRRKTGFGYANPGEFAQAQADYEARVQEVKQASNEYLKNLDSLNTLLGLPSNCEIKFQVSEVIPPVPKLPEKSVEDLRTLKAQKLRLQAAERDFDYASSNDAPSVQLVGKAYTYGSDREASGAYSDAVSGGHPMYYGGVRVQYQFGSNLPGETRLNRRYVKEAQEVLVSRVTQELQNSQAQAERAVQVAYAGVLSAVEQKKHRERALQQLSRSFNQGRTEISIYIEAMNKLSAAEIQYSKAIGDYQTALNAWASVRDELIPDAQEEK